MEYKKKEKKEKSNYISKFPSRTDQRLIKLVKTFLSLMHKNIMNKK